MVERATTEKVEEKGSSLLWVLVLAVAAVIILYVGILNIDILLPWVIRFVELNWRPLAQIILIPGLAFIMVFAIIGVWFERKFLAHAMLRIGPLYAGRVAGWLQIIADFLKLITKEVLIPADAEKALFYTLPIIIPTIPALAITLIPFGPNWYIFGVGGLGLLLFFAIISIAPSLPMLVGWASNNKYTFIGSIRTAYMFISMEIPLLLAAAGVVLFTGTFNLVEIVEAQSLMWFAIPQLLGFMVFFIGLLGESERVPFDISVAEQEIVFGWRTEYSGILFALTMMAEYISLCAWTLMFITLYLGGYLGPILFGSPLASHIIWVLVKLGIVASIIIFLRTVFPRYRIDQAIKIGWRYLTPLAILNIFITLIVKYIMLV